jgi:hypothetical protein
MECLTNPVGKSSLEVFPIWIPLIIKEVNKQ